MSRRKKKNKKEMIYEAARDIIGRLKKAGFIIHRYDSFSSNSIYLKLDYGVAGSIRISDHKGKKHLKYKYNVLTICPEPIANKDKEGYIRYYFPINHRSLVAEKASFDRDRRILHYGLSNYKRYMKKNKQAREYKKGFWEHAKLIQ